MFRRNEVSTDSIEPAPTGYHLDEDAQRAFLQQLTEDARIIDLMLPSLRSYGACTNRAFLIAASLGCESVHRRDSDIAYQERDGEKVYPIHHKLAIGAKAGDTSEVPLPAGTDDRPVVLAGASFIGDMSVDIDDIRQRDPEIYYDLVSLWARGDATETEKRALVEESFTGAGTTPFTADHSTLTIVDPMRVDMSNIAFYQVHEQVPLPPATETIGQRLLPDAPRARRRSARCTAQPAHRELPHR